jgi:hypothetical protein
MTRLLTCAALVAALLPACAGTSSPADAGFRSYYGASGAYAGGAVSRGGYVTHTDRGGRFVGSSVTRGNVTVIYGANGSRAGTIVRSGR